jgi:hemoglobin/transferrin/lactoferrin receptor protein
MRPASQERSLSPCLNLVIADMPAPASVIRSPTRHTLCLALLAALPPLAANPAPDQAELDAIVVVATKREQPVIDVPGTATAIDREQLDERMAQDIKEALRYEPGISVRNQASRFGLAGFNIRGLDGNRVAIEVDGIRQPEAFAIGDFANAGRNTVDLDLVKRIEIVRGAASSLYGSSALGGVVAFTSKAPGDYLAAEAGLGGEANLHHDGVNDGYSGNFTLAAREGPFSGLIALSHLTAEESDNQGKIDSSDRTRTRPNPQELRRTGVLAKLGWNAEAGSTLMLTAEHNEFAVETAVLSSLGRGNIGPSVFEVLAQEGDDRQLRQRLSLEAESGAALGFDRWLAIVYAQRAETTQATFERRNSLNAAGVITSRLERERSFRFDQDLAGFELTGHRSFQLGASEHYLVAGVDWVRTDTAQQRDGLQRNLVTGSVSNQVGPDAFPVRDFPLSEQDELALYVQDEIRLGDSGFSLLPGVRYDRYALDPQPDPVFAADNPGVVPTAFDSSSFSPKLGASYQLSGGFSLHAQYAAGFRAPPYNDVNVGFTNLQFGYTAIPNPDLEPEESDSYELGLRWRREGSAVALAVFDNRYRDFIESFVSLGVDPATNLLVFQSQNLGRVRIRGAELRFDGDLSNWLPGTSVHGALSHHGGDRTDLDAPLNSIDPDRATLGVRWRSSDERLRLEAVVSGARAKDRVDDAAGALFLSPGYAVVDLYARYRLSPGLTLRAGVFNIADRTYWEWADVRGRPASDTAIDRFTAPGRSFMLSLNSRL